MCTKDNVISLIVKTNIQDAQKASLKCEPSLITLDKLEDLKSYQELIKKDVFEIRKLMLLLSVAETRLADRIKEKNKLARDILEAL